MDQLFHLWVKTSCHLERGEKRPFFKRLFSNCCAFLNSEREYRFPFTKMDLVLSENSINNKRLAINQIYKIKLKKKFERRPTQEVLMQ